ncbi:hypothetical protein, partial [Aeromonas veronii]|uniref:hypothetical protein n=1 Tax=Aeromonas veronii TaxID=654 RepID=UPI00406D22F4
DNSPYAEDLNEDGRQERDYFNEINREVVPSVSEIMRQWQMQLKQPGTETKMMAGELRIVGGEDIAYGKARYHGDLSDRCV